MNERTELARVILRASREFDASIDMDEASDVAFSVLQAGYRKTVLVDGHREVVES